MAIDKAKILKAADKHIAKQNYNKALNELLKVQKVSPNDVNLLNKIGDLYSKLGKEKKAIDYFLKVAESYQTSGFNLKAIALYKKIMRLDDRYMDARHRLVDLYIQQGYHSETKGELRRMAEYYYSENLFARALSCYEKMVEIDPNNLDARIKITELLVREGKRDEAIEHFVAMGRELLEKTMVNEARKIITQGLRMSPEHPGLLILLSQAYLAEGKSDEALIHLTDICQREPENLEALNLLGQTYLSRNQIDDAKTLYLRAFELDSGQNPGPLEDVSRRLIEAGQLDDAFECLKPLGEVFLGRGEHEEATRLFRSILYANEEHLPSQEMLIRIYRESNQTANAMLLLEKVIHAYLDAGKDDMARARVTEILELDPNNQEWRDKLSELSANMTGGDLEADEIHVFDEQSIDTSIIDEGTLEVDLSDQHMEDEPESSKLDSHLTEAKVFIKYGIVDQALDHLEQAKELDFLNVEANQLLKDIYLQKGELKKAIPCMISLVNAALEEKNFDGAFQRIAELSKYSAEIADIHRGRVEAIAIEAGYRPQSAAPPPPQPPPMQEVPIFSPSDDGALDPGEGFDLDFGDEDEPIEQSAGDPLFSPPDNTPEVVDFRDMAPSSPPPPSPAEDAGGGWSLDMPAAVPPEPKSLPKTRASEDFQEVFNHSELAEASGTFNLPDLSELADDSRLDLSLPEDLADQAGDGVEEIDASDLLDLEASGTLETTLPPVEKIPTDAEIPAPKPPDPPKEERAKTHAPLGGSSQGSLASELEEIDFFISVEAFEDARNLLEDARKTFGEHPLLMERQHELDAKTQNEAQVQQGINIASAQSLDDTGGLSQGGGFFDLAAELSEELFEDGGSGEINDATSQEEIQSVEELFEEFRKGVDEQIDEGDHETHYDLGIAYKEMGLLEEAINEFQKASNDPNKFLECAIMIGNCQIELGRTEDALAHYQSKLVAPNLSNEADLALRYELAQAYQSFGELEKALDYLRQIKERDAQYRDVVDLIDALV